VTQSWAISQQSMGPSYHDSHHLRHQPPQKYMAAHTQTNPEHPPPPLRLMYTHPLVGRVDPVDVLPHALAAPVGQAGLVDGLSQLVLGDAVALHVGHTCGTHMWDTHVGHTCGTHMWDAHVGHTTQPSSQTMLLTNMSPSNILCHTVLRHTVLCRTVAQSTAEHGIHNHG
jgi:hypothetical protein